VAEPALAYESLSTEQAMKEIARLEQRMYKHAQELEFEEAAAMRDEIAEIRRVSLGLPDLMAG
jgi:excinuclease ABC subunit B